MLIAVELIVGSMLEKHLKKHIMLLFKVTGIGCDHFTERSPKYEEKSMIKNTPICYNILIDTERKRERVKAVTHTHSQISIKQNSHFRLSLGKIRIISHQMHSNPHLLIFG
jgi:hypothetical protein